MERAGKIRNEDGMKRTEYELIALDLDGTLLNSQHQITARAKEAIEELLRRGKQVVFATGRCRGELEEYWTAFPGMRYLICESGACVYDRKADADIWRKPLDTALILRILDAVAGEDGIASFFIGNRPFMDKGMKPHLEEFGLKTYARIFDSNVVWVEDFCSFYRGNPLEAEKINLFFRDGVTRQRVGERMRLLPLSLASSLAGNLEINAPGVNKGAALQFLCGRLSLPLDKTIAVGDNSNDEQMLETAGLAAVMENAVPALKKPGRILAPDCDHDGAAVIMEQYML